MTELVVDGNERFEAHWRRFQAGAIVVMACLVLCAGLGAAGSGPFSAVRRPVGAMPATLDFARFETRGTPAQIRLTFAAGNRLSEHELILDDSFLRAHRILSVVPQPAAAGVAGGGIRYLFRGQPGAGSVVLVVEPAQTGLWRSVLRVDGEGLHVRQAVLP